MLRCCIPEPVERCSIMTWTTYIHGLRMRMLQCQCTQTHARDLNACRRRRRQRRASRRDEEAGPSQGFLFVAASSTKQHKNMYNLISWTGTRYCECPMMFCMDNWLFVVMCDHSSLFFCVLYSHFLFAVCAKTGVISIQTHYASNWV